MNQDRRCLIRSTSLLLGLLAVSTLALHAQSEEDTDYGIRAPNPPAQFNVLTESETQSHQAKLHAEIKEKLNVSRLKTKHQDLIAHALSRAVSGMPIGSFRVSYVVEQTGQEREEDTNHFAVLETGYVQELKNGTETYFVDNNGTPFSVEEGLLFDFKRGRVSAQTKSEISYRFTTDIDMPTEDSSVGFLSNLQFLQNIEWAMELTIDKNERTVKSMSFFLARPVRKMFLFSLKTLSATYDFEFIEECGCVGVVKRTLDVAGSAIILGRMSHLTTETYSDIECEQPLRYLLPVGYKLEEFETVF